MEEKEEWAPVLGYESSYLVSNLGNIKSLIGKTRQSGNLVGQYYNSRKKKMSLEEFEKYHAYKQAHLWNAKLKNTVDYRVHRLVWEAFNGKIPEGMQINHINEIKDDNRLSNLNLTTTKENMNWGTRNARMAEKLTYSLSDAQAVLDAKFNKNINIIEYGGKRKSSTFQCNTCGDIFSRRFNDEQQYKSNGCLKCNRLVESAKQFEKAKAKLSNKFNGNIIFTDNQFVGWGKQSHFKCLTCGVKFTNRYGNELALHGNGHPRCPKAK